MSVRRRARCSTWVVVSVVLRPGVASFLPGAVRKLICLSEPLQGSWCGIRSPRGYPLCWEGLRREKGAERGLDRVGLPVIATVARLLLPRDGTSDSDAGLGRQ